MVAVVAHHAVVATARDVQVSVAAEGHPGGTVDAGGGERADGGAGHAVVAQDGVGGARGDVKVCVED